MTALPSVTVLPSVELEVISREENVKAAVQVPVVVLRRRHHCFIVAFQGLHLKATPLQTRLYGPDSSLTAAMWTNLMLVEEEEEEEEEWGELLVVCQSFHSDKIMGVVTVRPC